MVFCYLFAIIMLIVGITFFTGKALEYIKDFQATPEEEKKNINIKALCKNVSIMFFIAAAFLGAAGYSETFRLLYLKWMMVGWMILCCADVLYINKSKRYKTKPASIRK